MMKKEELLALGFKTTSYTDMDGNFFKQFTLDVNEFIKIETYGDSVVDICIFADWVNVPNCHTIADMKNLINLFS